MFSEPCVVARDTLGRVTIGHEAHAMIGRNPQEIQVMSPFNGGIVKNMEAVTEIIKYSLKRLAPRQWRRRFTLTMSTPTGLTPVELRAIEDAGRAAGARSVQFVNSCVAAAVGAGVPVEDPRGCLVVNLGGGVTEASLLSLRGVVASSVARIGGNDINEKLADYVRKQHSLLVGEQTVEGLKLQLCSNRTEQAQEIRGRDLLTGLPHGVIISREVVDEQIRLYSKKIIELISEVISRCPPELAGDIIEQGIILVGGGAKVERIVSELSSRLDAPVVVSEEPETCVIRGLTKQTWTERRKSLRRA